jgi:hypothetical protein
VLSVTVGSESARVGAAGGGGGGMRLRAHLRQWRPGRTAWWVVPLLIAAVTGLPATPSVAGAVGQVVPGIGTFNGVACPSGSQCLGVGTIFATTSSGAAGAAAPLNATSGAVSGGQSVQTIAGTGQIVAVSCPSDAQCLAVGENPDASEGVAVPLSPASGSVSAGQSVRSIPGIVMAAVACSSTTRCLGVGHAADGQGVAVPLDPATGAIATGESVQTISGTGGLGLEGVDCPTTALCLAVGEDASRSAGAAVPLDPATGAISPGRAVQSVTTKGVLVGTSCPSATSCLAVGWGADQPSVAVPLDPTTGMVPSGQTDQTISSREAMLSAVSCPSVLQCLAVGNDDGDPSNGQVVPLSPATGAISSGQAVQSLTGTGALNGVACPTATQCLAVGSGFGASGGVTTVLNSATGTPASPVVPPSPSSTPTTVPATQTSTNPTNPPTTVIVPGASRLAVTGGDVLPLVAGGGVLLAGGVALLALTSRSRRTRSAAVDRED